MSSAAEILPAKRRRGRPTVAQQELLYKHIIETAWKAFADEGFGNSTVQKICTNAGISLATFYRHFDGKKDIFEIAIRRMSEVESAQLDAYDGDDLEGFLIQFAIAHLRHYPKTHMLEGVRLIYAEAPRFPDLAKAFTASVWPWLNRLKTLLHQHRPELSPEEAREMAIMFMEMVGGRLERAYLLESGDMDVAVSEEHARRAVGVFLYGINGLKTGKIK